MEDAELYDIAFEVDGCDGGDSNERIVDCELEVVSSASQEPGDDDFKGAQLKACAPDSAEISRYAKFVRDLIIVSRRKMKEMKKTISDLNLKLEAGGVVICPHCTHQFKDRHNLLAPKYTKVFRASRRLEVEFHSLDDLNMWLQLNMMDMNSDGLPTLLTAAPAKESLRSLGSQLPELIVQSAKSATNAQLHLAEDSHQQAPQKAQVETIKEVKLVTSEKPDKQQLRDRQQRQQEVASVQTADSRNSTVLERPKRRFSHENDNENQRKAGNGAEKRRKVEINILRSSANQQNRPCYDGRKWRARKNSEGDNSFPRAKRSPYEEKVRRDYDPQRKDRERERSHGVPRRPPKPEHRDDRKSRDSTERRSGTESSRHRCSSPSDLARRSQS